MRRPLSLCLAAMAFAVAACEQPLAPTAPAGVGRAPGGFLSAVIAQAGVATAVNAESGAGTLTIARPADVAAGDLLLAHITFEKGADISNLVRPSVDWVLVRRTNSIDAIAGTDLGQATLYKVAGDAEPAGYTWEFRNGPDLQQVRAAGSIIRYQGVNLLHPNGPILGSSGGAGDGIVLTAPGVNALEDAVLVAFFGHKKLTTLTDPAGMANLYQVQHSNESGPTIRASEETTSADGATGPRISLADAVVGGDKWVAQMVALRSNTKPVYSPAEDQDAAEGEDKAFALGSFVDADGHASWEITVDWGDATAPEVITYANTNPADPFVSRELGTRNHTYADNNPDDAPYTVTVTVDDGSDSDDGTFSITVFNVAPTVTAAADQVAVSGVAKAFNLGGFSDAGVDDYPWAVDVNWGDGSTNTAFNVNAQGSLGTQNHTYASANTYTVTVTVTDKDGDSHSDTFTVTVTTPGFQFYLHNRAGQQPSASTTRMANLPMNDTVPTNTGALPNYDTNSDGGPGRLIQKNSPSPTQTDLTKYQNWVSPAFAGAFTINKTTNNQVKIWTAMKDNNTTKLGQILIYIRDCPGTPQAGCVVIGQAVYNRPAGGAFSQAAVTVPWTFVGTTHTVLAGHRLEVKMVVTATSGDDVWFGYDTVAMPALFKYPHP